MKRLLSIFIVLITLITACEKVDESKRPKTDTQEIKNKATEVAAVMSEKARQERDEFVSNIQAEMDALNIQMEELAQRAETESGEIKEKMNHQLKSLKEKRNKVLQKMAEIESETSEKWYTLKAGVSSALEDLKQAIKGKEQ